MMHAYRAYGCNKKTLPKGKVFHHSTLPKLALSLDSVPEYTIVFKVLINFVFHGSERETR
jgi:hypothetical protein